MAILTQGIEQKGSLKTFVWNFQSDGSIFSIIPSAGKKIRLGMIRGVLGVNTEVCAVVLEILMGNNIVKQLYYHDWNVLLSQMDEVNVIDSLYYFKKKYIQNPDEDPVELRSSLGMSLRIYFTNDPKHAEGVLTAYTVKNTPLGKKDVNNPAEPVASCTFETLSFDEV